MATIFDHNGNKFEIIEGTDEVILRRSGEKSGDVILPKYAMYNDKRYTVTKIIPLRAIRMENRNAEDKRKKPDWRSTSYTENTSLFCIYDRSHSYNGDPKDLLPKVDITSIIIPSTVTEIGEYTFYNCHLLKSITIPDGVTSIGECAFRCCSSLTSITIPDSVTKIGKYAFYNCSSLTSVTIPNSVIEINSGAFAYVPNAEIIIYNEPGEVMVATDAFAPTASIKYVGKKAKTDKKEPPKKDEEQVTAPAPTIDLDKLIEAVVGDGVITDKERAVILKKATAAGYDADEVEILLDGKLAEKQSASQPTPKVVTPAKADMESMIAYQHTDDAVETAVDIKKRATCGDYTINIASNNSVSILKGGVACNNAKGALREIAALVGFEVDTAWTTQQLGSKLVDAINSGDYVVKYE